MKFLAKLTPAFVALFLAVAPTSAQNLVNNEVILTNVDAVTIKQNFTDAQPAFRQWQPAYSVTKIDYTADEMVVHFQYKEGYYSYVTLWAIGQPQAFVLRDQNGNIHQPKAIRNVKDGGQLLHADISQNTVSFSTTENQAITCEIVFPRLAKDITKVDLIEGTEYLEYTNHFHVFDITVKNETELTQTTVVDIVNISKAQPQELIQPIEYNIDEFININLTENTINEPDFTQEFEFNEPEYPEYTYISGRTTAAELSPEVKTINKPKYTKHAKTYTVDKIAYHEKEMVITFTFHDGWYSSGTFYGPQAEANQAWFLRDKNGNTYPVRAVNNLRKDNQTIIAEGISTAVVVSEELKIYFENYEEKEARFTCEIVFDRLPKGVKVVDLIEGQGNEELSNHFNAFDIKIHQFKDNVEPAVEPVAEPVVEPAVEPVVGQATERNNFEVAVSANYRLFPNPNQGNFSITNNGKIQEKAFVQVLDLAGRIVFSQQVTFQEQGTQAFKVDNLVAGQYLVRVVNADQSFETLKMTVVE